MNSLGLDESVPEVTWAAPGTKSGIDNLDRFLLERLKLFGSKRNDPNVEACSDMSPWLKFGQVSAARCALEAKARWEKNHTQNPNPKSRGLQRIRFYLQDLNISTRTAVSSKRWLTVYHTCSANIEHLSCISRAHYRGKSYSESVASFVEELIVRKELSDNFCFYNKKYDSLEGCAQWAQDSLEKHSTDKRSHIYSREQLEAGKTHDQLWNAAQVFCHSSSPHASLD